MGKKIHFFLILIWMFFPGFVFAQVNIEVSGRVLDAETDEPLAGVNVLVKETQTGGGTDARGYFHLRFRSALPYTLRFSMIGYISRELTVSDNPKSGIRIRLASQTYQGKEVVVTAPVVEVEQKTIREAVTIEMLDALSVKETPAANYYESLANLKGVDVATQSMQFMTVNARGFNSTENIRFVQVVDGMDNQAPGMNFAIGNIAGLNELDVDEMEFIPGPANARYGGNALNGLLLMKSKDPFQYPGVGFYIKPGVSDVHAGSDHPFQFIGKPMIDAGLRVAHVFGDRFAIKLNAAVMTGKDWYADDTTNIRPGSVHWLYDPGHDALNKYGDEVIETMPLGENGKDIIVARTGYRDKYLINNRVKNLKFNGALHYKITPKLTAILAGMAASATTAYTGDNRISLTDFKIYQAKAEINGERLLLRGYTTQQATGQTYDSRFLAYHLNRAWKSDEKWFRDYRNAYLGHYLRYGIRPMDHKEARYFADQGRLMPGTPEFEKKKQAFIAITNFSEGAGMINNSGLYHIDASYDLKNIIPLINIEIGGNYRYYDLISEGTIFPDTTGNHLHYFEYGGFVNMTRDLLNKTLHLEGALRYDRSEHFTGHFAPRFSALYTLKKKHNFRFSAMKGYRNPSAKEQFINQDLATARLLGGLKGIYQDYDIPGNSFYLQNVLAFNDSIYNEQNAPDVMYSPDQSVIRHLDVLESGRVSAEDLTEIRPEQVYSFEAGYKTMFGKFLFLDAAYYYSRYKDFIGLIRVVKPRTSPETDLFMAAKQVNSSSTRDVFYIYTNSQSVVAIQGFSAGWKWITPVGAILSGNFTWSDIRSDVTDPLVPGFNTPPFKMNFSLANRRLDKMENNPGFKNVGFKVNWRYQSRFLWQSSFGDGWVEPINTFDVQFSYNFTKPKSLLKAGITNFFDIPYANTFGGTQVGVFYYISYRVDDFFGGRF
ncbi:MAG: TonB-dependent receptor [Chlorobi bacterium]|nr:TonB-dependent receptor [Chlorobiota bacterium]